MIGSERLGPANCAFDACRSEARAKLHGALDVSVEHGVVELVKAEIEVARNVV